MSPRPGTPREVLALCATLRWIRLHFQAQLSDAVNATFFFFPSEACVRVSTCSRWFIIFPVYYFIRALFIAAITIMPWSFEEDFTSLSHHSPRLLEIFVLWGHVGSCSDLWSTGRACKLGAKLRAAATGKVAAPVKVRGQGIAARFGGAVKSRDQLVLL